MASSTEQSCSSSLKSTALVQSVLNKEDNEGGGGGRRGDVLTRLDSLVSGGSSNVSSDDEMKSGPTSVGSDTSSSAPSSILKIVGGGKGDKKKSIRFPEHEDMHEIIGYGGDEVLYSSEDDEDTSTSSRCGKRDEKDAGDELTVEEKNVLNLTRKNTTFNAHAQNLNGNGAAQNSTPLRLGVDKKVTPLITVRPFVRDHTPGKVNMVSPMINGEIVKASASADSSALSSAVLSKDDSEVDSGRGEVKQPNNNNNQKQLNSDGGSEEGSSSSDSEISNTTSNNSSKVVRSNLTSVVEREFMKKKQTAASARLSFLNSTIAFEAKGEPTTEIVSNAVVVPSEEEAKAQEEEEAVKQKNPNVKLTRKSPYVVGPYASTSILKGTPKPAIVRKPPIGREKPKVPQKPDKLLQTPSSSGSPSSSTSTSRTSSVSVSPVAAPRKASFRKTNEYANVSNSKNSEVTISDESRIELSNIAECYSADADVQNAVIIDVSTSNLIKEEDTGFTINAQQANSSSENTVQVKTAADIQSSPELPMVQKKLAMKNKEALDAIRKSLTQKITDQNSRIEEDENEDETTEVVEKAPLEKTVSNTSSNFEATRATIANALGGGFNRQDKVLRPSTKRQAPRPPPTTVNDTEAPTKDLPPEPEPENQEENQPVQPVVMPKSALATTRHSSIKSESSPKNREQRSVQFNPETVTVTVPSSEPDLQPISYNRWISRDPHGSPGIVESSFTGQPISVQPNQRPPMGNSHPNKKPVMQALQGQVCEDEVRRWTEKKKPRSKSLPRGSEIDEIMGSSKTKPPTRLFPIVSASPPQPATATTPVHRQSRVELYEADRKQQMRKQSKFSLRKLFKIGSNPNLSSDTTNNVVNSKNDPNKFLDKEHEREILERERNRMRPEIIHPLDLQRGGVEVVTITPNKSNHVYEKNQRTAGVNKAGVTKSILANKAKLEYVDSKDSGHETSSIHTENSEGSSSGSGGNDSGTTDTSHSNSQAHNGDIFGNVPPPSRNRLNSAGRPKPVPPPRSHSLENFDKKDEDEDEVAEQAAAAAAVVIEAKTAGGNDSNNGHHQVFANAMGGMRTEKPQRTGSIRENDNEVVVVPTSEEEAAHNKEEANNESLPPSGYIVAGKMRLGAISVPALNSVHLRSNIGSKKMPPFRSESVHSSSSSSVAGLMLHQRKNSFTNEHSETDFSERESISPHRLLHEEHADEDENSSSSSTSTLKSANRRHGLSRLSVRKGRSVVHKNLEDNYGAVISANHEALAQILEQTSQQQRPDVGKTLKPLQDDEHLSLAASFSIIEEAEKVATRVGDFYAATYATAKAPVTLLIGHNSSCTNSAAKNAFSLCPVTTFHETAIPSQLMQTNKEGTVSVFNRLQVETLESYTQRLKASAKMNSQSWEKEVSFVLLQLTNGLKSLQAQGIEEVAATLSHFLLVRADKDPHYRIVILDNVCEAQNDEKMSLCQTALAAMLLLFQCSDPVQTSFRGPVKLPELTPSVGMFRTMADLLQRGSAMALGQVKAMLEYMLWGPSDIAFEMASSPPRSRQQTREQGLQRWLDLERATVLHNLIRTQGLWRIHLTVFEEYHLLFLVQTCAKMLHEASLLFESEVACM